MRQLWTTTHENKRCHHTSSQMMFTKLCHFNKVVQLFQESNVISGLLPLSVLLWTNAIQLAHNNNTYSIILAT